MESDSTANYLFKMNSSEEKNCANVLVDQLNKSE